MLRDDDTDRRTVLRTLAAGTAAAGVTAAASNPVAASAAPTADRAESAFETHAEGVLAQLAEDGVVDGPADLPTNPARLGDLTDGGEGVTSVTLEDGSEEIRSSTTVDAGRLSVAVHPETGHAYAIVDTGAETIRYDDTGSDSVETDSYSCSCRNEICNYPYTLEVCRDDITGEIVDTNCVC
jgi:hypothetical protein